MAVAGLIAGGIEGVAGVVEGLFKNAKANRLLANNQFPEYTIPSAIMQNQRLAAILGQSGLPGYSSDLNNIYRSQANANQQSQNYRGGLLNAGSVQANTNNALDTLGVDTANAVRQNQQIQMGANTQYGQYQDQAWSWNQQYPYLRNYQYAMGLKGAANQNINSGVDALGAAGTNYANMMFGGVRTGQGQQQGSALPFNIQNNNVAPTYYPGQYTNQQVGGQLGGNPTYQPGQNPYQSPMGPYNNW